MIAAEPAVRSASFRDPGGQVFRHSARIFRTLTPAGSATLSEFLQTTDARRLEAAGSIVRTWEPDSLPAELSLRECRVVEHEPVAFPSFPSEWCPEMLTAAGNLTLDLCEQLLPSGWGIKDGTPWNILFRGVQPVFVDLLSFEKREVGDPIWIAYAQFVRTFVLPLLAGSELGNSQREIWLANRDGLEPERVYRSLSMRKRLTPRILSSVTLPAVMTKRASATTPQGTTRTGSEEARFVLQSVFRSLRRQLKAFAPAGAAKSHWSGYTETLTHYDDQQKAAKEAFVRDSLAKASPSWCLDVGANTGQFSEIAAEKSQVVALDYDVASVGRIWTRARALGLNILPLCVDICRPTPATGWRNHEQPAFLDRCAGRFDMVMMLAVAHHMLVTERVPLDEIISLAAELTTANLIIEYVGPGDPMFQKLLLGRDALHAGYGVDVFEAALQREFRIEASLAIPGLDRKLYWGTRGR